MVDKCPDCHKYTCICKQEGNDYSDVFSRSTTLALKESKQQEKEIDCPWCGGHGYTPNMILCGDDPCFNCGFTGKILAY